MSLPKKAQFIQEVVEPQKQVPVEPQVLQEILDPEICEICADSPEGCICE